MSDRVVRWTRSAAKDLVRLFEFLAEQDPDAAERALLAIRKALEVVRAMPYMCRKAASDPTLRELVITFGTAGYVALYRIRPRYISVLAVRHQREDDFH